MTKETRKIGICLLFLVLAFKANGQYGISGKFQLNQYESWDKVLDRALSNPTPLFQNYYEAALEYKIALSSFRLEIIPELTMGFSESNLQSDNIDNRYSLIQYGGGIKIRLFPFDLGGDCTCPTFSMEGSAFSNGFFFQLNTAANYMDKTVEDRLQGRILEHVDRILRIGAGAGMDFGISNSMTITPVLSYLYTTNADWGGLGIFHGLEDLTSNEERSSIKGLELAMTLTFYIGNS